MVAVRNNQNVQLEQELNEGRKKTTSAAFIIEVTNYLRERGKAVWVVNLHCMFFQTANHTASRSYT
ncbi:hypothetical protein EIV80_19660 [Salmonella enterica]|nr:hypothetical protein [Salmonella enterica]EAR3518357.1 hypothetical protein [Salmonella enterica]EAU7239270.1 hypothetical protein [Salmonella enterica]